MIIPFSRIFRVEHGPEEEASLIVMVYIYMLECVALRSLITDYYSFQEPKEVNLTISLYYDAHGRCSFGDLVALGFKIATLLMRCKEF